MRRSLGDERGEPCEHEQYGPAEGDEACRAAARVRTRERAHEREPEQRHDHEKRIRRMHECEIHSGGGECQRDRPGRGAHEAEEERDHRGHEQLPRDRPWELERRVRAAASRSETDHPDLREQHGEGEPERAKDLAPHLEGEHERERREDARLVQDDGCRIDSSELRHEREPAVPERERVAGMKAAVPELVDRPQRQRAEVVELADAP